MEDQTLQDLSLKVGAALGQQELMLASAESCTGGWLGQAITSKPEFSQATAGGMPCSRSSTP